MQLVIKCADGSQQSVSLAPGKQLKLGSDPGSDIVVAGAGMQKIHCGFMHKDGKFHVVATKASQQIEVNGKPVQNAALTAGTKIKLPAALITVQEEQPAADDDFGLLPLEGEAPASKPAAPAPSAPKPADDEFGLAPMDDEPAKPAKPSKPAAPAGGGLEPLDEPGLVPVDDGPALKPVDDEFGLAPVDEPKQKPAPKNKPADTGGLQPLDDSAGLQPLDDGGLEPLGEVGLAPLDDEPPKKKKKKKQQPAASAGLTPLEEPPAADGLSPLDELPASGGLDPLDDLSSDGLDASLDELSSDALASPTDAALGGSAALASPPPKKPKQPSAFSLFLKSPAFKALAMGIVALAALGLVLLIAFTLPTADSRFELANASYQGKQYDTAVEDFNNFLSWHETDPRAGEARAKRGLCQLLPLAAQKNWSALISKTEQVVAEVGGDARHEEFRKQLAATLPPAAASLTDRVEANLRKPDVAKSALAEAEAALALVKKYVPPKRASEQGIPEVEVRLVQLSRQLAMDESQAAALAEITASVDGGEPNEAYRVRRELLLRYPQLSSGLELQAAMQEVGNALRSKVKFSQVELQVSSNEPSSPVTKTLVPVAWSGAADGATVAAENVVCLSSPATGSVYAVNANNGGLLWRRFVGTGLPGRPVLIGEPAAGVIVVDSRTGCVQRLEVATGKLVWQTYVPNLCGSVTVTEDEVLVPTHDGTLALINHATGASNGEFKFPQPLTCPPVLDPLNRSILQPGDHSNLYVITADKLCDSVAYLGHESAGVSLAPVMIDRFLLVFESGLDTTTVHVYQRRDWKELQSVSINGLVTADPLVVEESIYISTSNGLLHAFELEAAKPKPLVAFPAIRSGTNATAGVAVANDRLWVAGRGLRVFDLPLDRKAPEPADILYPDTYFTGPPIVDGSTLVTARHAADAAGMIVSGTSADDALQSWSTQVAPPGAVVASADGTRLWVLQAGGALFELTEEQLGPASPNVLSKPTAAVDIRGSLSLGSGLPWGDGQAVLAPGDFPGLFVASAGDEDKLRVRSLPGGLAVAPQPVGNQLLIATVGGPIFLVDPASDSTPGIPFLPRIEAGKLPQWRGPALIDGATVLVSDGHGTLYKLGITGPGKLEEQLSAKAGSPIVTPLAAAGAKVWGADAQGTLVSFDGELRSAGNLPLNAPVGFGPKSLGNIAVISTADGRLLGLGDQPNPLWEVPLKHGQIVGAVRHQDRLILASRTGVVFGVHPDSGQPTGTALVTGQPLAGSPVLMGKHLVLPGSDGSLHVISDALNLILSGAAATAAR